MQNKNQTFQTLTIILSVIPVLVLLFAYFGRGAGAFDFYAGLGAILSAVASFGIFKKSENLKLAVTIDLICQPLCYGWSLFSHAAFGFETILLLGFFPMVAGFFLSRRALLFNFAYGAFLVFVPVVSSLAAGEGRIGADVVTTILLSTLAVILNFWMIWQYDLQVAEGESDSAVQAFEAARSREVAARFSVDLQKSQGYLSQVYKALDVSAIISETDKFGTITHANAKFCEISGYSEEELIGQNHRIVKSGLESPEIYEDLWKTISQGKSWSGEIRNRKKSGEIYFVQTVISPILNLSGQVDKYLSVRFDVTEMRRFYHQLADAQRIAKIGSFDLNPFAQIMIWTPEMYRIFEIPYPQSAENLRELFWKAVHPDDSKRVSDFMGQLLDGGSTVLEHRLSFDQGKRIKYLRVTATVVRDSAGKAVSIQATCQDRTEDVQIQMTLEEQQRKILTSSRLAMLGELSAGVAHEINNPLSVIAGMVSLLPKVANDPEKLEGKIKLIERSIGRIGKIIKGLKKFTRAESHVERKAHGILDLLHEALVLTDLKTKVHSVSMQLVGETTAQIWCDSDQILQVLVNLINNAADAIAERKDRWIRVELEEKDNDVFVRVVDSGDGISQDIEEKLFQPFFTTKPVGVGTGLGLSIVKGILDEHSAAISINHEFKNTCFELRFPKYTGQIAHDPAASDTQSKVSSAS